MNENEIREMTRCLQCDGAKPKGDLFCDACHLKYWPVCPPIVAQAIGNDLGFYDDKSCADCSHLGREHNDDGECLRCECETYHWHEGCEQ